MTRIIETALAALAALTLAGTGCVGEAPTNDNGGADAGPSGGSDGGAPIQQLDVSGMVMDYFTGDPLPTATVDTEGILPAIAATADGTGAFTLANVPAGSTFYASANFGSNYRQTRNEPIAVLDTTITANLYVISQADEQRQYASVNMTRVLDTAFVVIDLRRNNGDPLIGALPADVVLLDVNGELAGDGPYFFGAGGDIRSNDLEPASAVYNGKARAAFLNVPAGAYTLEVTYLNGQQQPVTNQAPVTALPNGATLVSSGGNGGGGGGGGDGGDMMATYTFRADIYPKLQKASLGGMACANCHNPAGVAALLPFDGAIDATYELVTTRLGVVNLASPAESLLLTKPLYEDPPNHPNATFLDVNDPTYMMFMMWIEQGALLDPPAGGQ